MIGWGIEPDGTDQSPAPGWPWVLALLVLLCLWGYLTPSTLDRDAVNEQRAREAQIRANDR